MNQSCLKNELLEQVLARLGFSHRPDPAPETLRSLYSAWCQRVPFDNVQKLIYIRAGHSGPFPGTTAEDFFQSWLKHGTGGTCWAGAGACQALLQSLGFDAVRGIATMMAGPNLPPNHGTVQVTFGQERYLVDCSILHGEPLPLDENTETHVEHPAWGVRCRKREGRWHVAFRPLHKVDGFECRLECFGAGASEFATNYEKTRLWSPFNYEVHVRSNRSNRVIGAAFGHAVSLHSDGSVSSKPMGHVERVRLLVEEIGMSEEIASQLPADMPTPPPPGSRTAEAASESATR